MQWKEPTEDGGCPLDGYILEYRVEGSKAWRQATMETILATSYQVTGLMEGMNYEFRVAATNRAGQGPYSNTSRSTKAQEVIGQYIDSHQL